MKRFSAEGWKAVTCSRYAFSDDCPWPAGPEDHISVDLGVRVNAIAPGEIDTAIISPGTADIVEKISLQRLGTASEVADVIYFLCSDAAAYVTGARLHVNGGQHV